MANWDELKRLAEEAQSTFGSFDPSEAEFDFMSAITPDVILALIAENEQLREDHDKQWRLAQSGIQNTEAVLAENAKLRAENERLQNLAGAMNSAMHSACMAVGADPAELADVIHKPQVKVAMLQKQRTELNMEAAHLIEDSDEMAADLVEARKEREQFRAERDALKHALDVKEEFYQDALHSHIVLARQRDQLRAEVEALKSHCTDWQAKCLKRGFEYVRESDDHYVLADTPEMAALLGELLGIEVRSKDNESYGETVSELREQLESANASFHRAYELEKENEALQKDAERYRWLRSVENDVAITFGTHAWEDLSDEYMDAAIDAAMGKGGRADG